MRRAAAVASSATPGPHPRRGDSRREPGRTRRSGRRRRPRGDGGTSGSPRPIPPAQVIPVASGEMRGDSVWSIIPALTTEIAQTDARRAATELVRGLAARGHVVGDARIADGSAGVYEHHDPATGVMHAEVALGGAEKIDDSVRAARDALPVWR